MLTQNEGPGGSNASNEAFWEVWFGNTENNYGLLQKIPAGDWARANVNYPPGNQFTGTVTNVTTGQVTGWSYPAFGDAPTIGEALVEHPVNLTLADFGSIDFRAASVDGTELNWNPTRVTASDGSMTTNDIGNGGAFTVDWKHC